MKKYYLYLGIVFVLSACNSGFHSKRYHHRLIPHQSNYTQEKTPGTDTQKPVYRIATQDTPEQNTTISVKDESGPETVYQGEEKINITPVIPTRTRPDTLHELKESKKGKSKIGSIIKENKGAKKESEKKLEILGLSSIIIALLGLAFLFISGYMLGVFIIIELIAAITGLISIFIIGSNPEKYRGIELSAAGFIIGTAGVILGLIGLVFYIFYLYFTLPFA